MEHIKYRGDIDGLRAVSIIGVLLFHVFPWVFPFGYIGVDIFFLISGYLISSIVLENYKNNKFSYLDFYVNRINRIFPAFIITLLMVIYFGYYILDDIEQHQLKSNILYSTLFLENFKLISESGYFDIDSKYKPLMHIWSLSVEEQFYILYPVFFIYILNINKIKPIVISAITIIFFFIYLLVNSYNEKYAFYLPITRVWEFSIGGILAIIHQNNSTSKGQNSFKIDLILVGVIFILVGLFLISPSNFLTPTMLTLIVIFFASCLIYIGKYYRIPILSSRIMIYIGVISYPLYLYHWPLVSYGHFIKGPEFDLIWGVGIILASMLLATFTYFFIESKWKKMKSPKFRASILITLLMITAFMATNVLAAEPTEIDADSNMETCNLKNLDPSYFRLCLQDKRIPKTYILVGDSKAQAAYRGIINTSSANHRWYVVGGAGGSDFKLGPPLPLLPDGDFKAMDSSPSTVVLRATLSNPNITAMVYISAIRNLIMQTTDGTYTYQNLTSTEYEGLYKRLSNFALQATSNGQKLVFVEDVPWLPDPKECMPRETRSNLLNKLVKTNDKYLDKNCMLSLDKYNLVRAQYKSLLNKLVTQYRGNVFLVNITDIFCDAERGFCEPIKNNVLLYSHTDHMSYQASLEVGKRLNKVLNSFK